MKSSELYDQEIKRAPFVEIKKAPFIFRLVFVCVYGCAAVFLVDAAVMVAMGGLMIFNFIPAEWPPIYMARTAAASIVGMMLGLVVLCILASKKK